MKVVIDVNEKTYEHFKEETPMTTNIFVLDLARAIKEGTPLPEHHGRLIDADAIPRHLVRDIDEIDKQPTIIEGSDSE